jgi:recombination protein RecT
MFHNSKFQRIMANEIQKQERPIDLMKSVINAPSVQEQFQNALGDHKDAFVASLIDLFTGDKALQTCKPAAIIAEALRAATLRLPLNKALGFAYIIVFNNSVKNDDGSWSKIPTPTFVPGYKGYIQLAMRTGQYRTINADFVYEGEMRKVSKLTGEIALDGEKKSDKIIGYFCYFELLNGFNKTLFVSVEDMAQYALRYSPSFKGKNKPSADALIKLAQANQPSTKVGWEGNFNDMALKTVIRRLLSKYGYLSVEMQNALAKDVEDAQMSRNDLIIENANTQAIDIDSTQYEEVDTETGEIKNGEDAAPANGGEAAPEPNY